MIDATFTHRDFQTAMTRYRAKLDYGPYLKPLVPEPTLMTKFGGSLELHHAAAARVVNGSLLIRVQHYFLIPRGEAMGDTTRNFAIYICPHLGRIAQDPQLQFPT